MIWKIRKDNWTKLVLEFCNKNWKRNLNSQSKVQLYTFRKLKHLNWCLQWIQRCRKSQFWLFLHLIWLKIEKDMIVWRFYPIMLLMSLQIDPNPAIAPGIQERCMNPAFSTDEIIFWTVKTIPKVRAHGHIGPHVTRGFGLAPTHSPKGHTC